MIILEEYERELATGCYKYPVLSATHQYEGSSLILLFATCSNCNNNMKVMDGLLKDNYKNTLRI